MRGRPELIWFIDHPCVFSQEAQLLNNEPLGRSLRHTSPTKFAIPILREPYVQSPSKVKRSITSSLWALLRPMGDISQLRLLMSRTSSLVSSEAIAVTLTAGIYNRKITQNLLCKFCSAAAPFTTQSKMDQRRSVSAINIAIGSSWALYGLSPGRNHMYCGG
jgi:hypothetical protein